MASTSYITVDKLGYFLTTLKAAYAGNTTTGSTFTVGQSGKLSTARTISFATGDVTGSFSFDGSADVSDVSLTIGEGKVTNAMLAGSIEQSKISGLSDALAAKADASTVVTDVAYDTSNHRITKTINGTESSVISIDTTPGGTYNSSDLITSGAVNQGFASISEAKVDKVKGKDLSTNDLTDTLKGEYDAAYTHSTSTHAPTDAEKNTIITVKVNGTALTPDANRAVDVIVPSATVTDVQVKHRDAASYSSVLDGTIAKIDLDNYALKSEVVSIFTYKGEKTGAQLRDLMTTPGDTKTGWIYTCSADDLTTTPHFHQGYEYCAQVSGSGSSKTCSWVELGQWIDISGKVDKTQKVNGKELQGDIILNGADIALTGYSKGTSGAIAAADTINSAFGKLEAKADDTNTSLTAHTSNNDIHVTATQKTAWTAKYDKPTNGIPSTDMTTAVQTSLGKADTAIQSVTKGTGNGTISVDGGADVTIYTHPTTTAAAAGFKKVGNDASGHVVLGDAIVKADITALGIPAQDTTYDDYAGTATHGLVPGKKNTTASEEYYLNEKGEWQQITAVANSAIDTLFS